MKIIKKVISSLLILGIGIYIWVNLGLWNAFLYWVLVSVAWSLNRITRLLLALILLIREMTRVAVTVNGTPYKKIAEATEKVVEELSPDEINTVYSGLAGLFGARVWSEQYGSFRCINRYGIRNVVSRFLGIDDPVVSEYIASNGHKEKGTREMDSSTVLS